MAKGNDRYKAFMAELRALLRRYGAEIQRDTLGWGNYEREALVVSFRDGVCHELPMLIDGEEATDG